VLRAATFLCPEEESHTHHIGIWLLPFISIPASSAPSTAWVVLVNSNNPINLKSKPARIFLPINPKVTKYGINSLVSRPMLSFKPRQIGYFLTYQLKVGKIWYKQPCISIKLQAFIQAKRLAYALDSVCQPTTY
jgi:hypothetical protein